ncbi:hypothetical protein DFI_18645 (plasmid) [Deinococcus ficus]|uniref:Uncharacterized protein n=2 Tax=Deinococcus ficus TaxID=317577 RepID=A0A221T2S2_9DEIO|nr:hypothetical protein DFI_18645 [Deinococcus ficus]
MDSVYTFYRETLKGLSGQTVIGYQITRYNKLYPPNSDLQKMLGLNNERLQLYAAQYASLMDIIKQFKTVRLLGADRPSGTSSGFKPNEEETIINLHKAELERLLGELNRAVDETYRKARECLDVTEKICPPPSTAHWFRRLPSFAIPVYDAPRQLASVSSIETDEILPFDPSHEFLPQYKVVPQLVETFLSQQVNQRLQKQLKPVIPQIKRPRVQLR